MSAVEIVLGDFAPGVVSLRRLSGGRAILRVKGHDGLSEEIALHQALAGCAEHSEGRVAGYLRHWLALSGSSLDALLADSFRHERLFVVILHDGRKFVARGTVDVMAELKSMVTSPPSARPQGRGMSIAGLFAWIAPSRLGRP